MHEDLVAQFNARRPLLTHVAKAIETELVEAFADADLPARVKMRAATGDEFSEQLESRSQSIVDPLTEIGIQVAGDISVESMDMIQPITALVGEILTVISADWLDPPENDSQRMGLTCLIPPQAQPPGWAARRDVPRVFSLCVRATPGLRVAGSPVCVAAQSGVERPLALIMKGGGIKGLAYVGALEALADTYKFNWFIGTSAGAIAAVLLAAGYTPSELRAILEAKDFREFFDARWYAVVPNLFIHHGCYKADAFTAWLDDLLAKKLKSYARVRLSHLPYRATVYASRRNQSALKFDSVDNDADAAYAVRCSMSIPLVFIPQSDQGIRTFDGGIQNNFPVEALLRDFPDTDFISLFLGSETYEPMVQRWVVSDLLSIWTEATDAEVVHKYRDRTIVIDPRPISTLDFKLTADERSFLLAAGRAAALAHLGVDSAIHLSAIQERDQLKQLVDKARAKKRRRRRLIAAFILLTLLGIAGWRYWRSSAATAAIGQGAARFVAEISQGKPAPTGFD